MIFTVELHGSKVYSHITGVPRGGGLGGFKPPIESSQKILYCVFAKYILQALLLSSLNPKFYTGKR